MQMLRVYNNTTLADVALRVGSSNVDSVIAANQLVRRPDIGRQLRQLHQQAWSKPSVSLQRKITLLNSSVSDSDIFEASALLDENGWKTLDEFYTLPNTLRIPDSIVLPKSAEVYGNGQAVTAMTYKDVMQSMSQYGEVPVDLFSEYSAEPGASYELDVSGDSPKGLFEAFHLPQGLVTLYSSLSGDHMDFPVYPEELSDSRSANFTTMPDLLYQYEPWQLYQSSGPRTNKYTFKFHRDMWTGNHRDGKANELIRFCEANCYPEFNGAAVNVSTVALYVAGQKLISGVMTGTDTHWEGPIGLDNWYLQCQLEITITEVSDEPLNYTSVRSKGLIG